MEMFLFWYLKAVNECPHNIKQLVSEAVDQWRKDHVFPVLIVKPDIKLYITNNTGVCPSHGGLQYQNKHVCNSIFNIQLGGHLKKLKRKNAALCQTRLWWNF